MPTWYRPPPRGIRERGIEASRTSAFSTLMPGRRVSLPPTSGMRQPLEATRVLTTRGLAFTPYSASEKYSLLSRSGFTSARSLPPGVDVLQPLKAIAEQAADISMTLRAARQTGENIIRKSSPDPSWRFC